MALRLAPLDRATIVFAAIASLAFVWRWPEGRPLPALPFLFHAALVAMALLAPWARGRGAAGRFAGDFYALVAALGMYTEIGVLNRAAGITHDGLVQAWEQALFGGQPSMDWIRAWPWPWVSWPLHLGYLSYYLVLAGSPLGLLLSGRREAAGRAATLIMAAFYVCYSTFLWFPVAGPRYTFPLARNAATAILPARFTQDLLNAAGAWGTAFPSSHVAAALVAALSAWVAWRALGAVLLVAAILLTLGTVYGQFHYAVDALAGVAVALAAWLARGAFWRTPS